MPAGEPCINWDVRPCSSADELRGTVAPIWYYFGRSVPIDEQFQRVERVLPPERMYAAWEKGYAVGGAGAFPFVLTVPGGRVAAAGVTAVAVLSTHRRRGVLRALMRAQLEDCRERGDGRLQRGTCSLVPRDLLICTSRGRLASPPGRVSYLRNKLGPSSRPILSHARTKPSTAFRSLPLPNAAVLQKGRILAGTLEAIERRWAWRTPAPGRGDTRSTGAPSLRRRPRASSRSFRAVSSSSISPPAVAHPRPAQAAQSHL
jgi:GNAT superfamily N-acetyltransferase